jgi:hypothetical protein
MDNPSQVPESSDAFAGFPDGVRADVEGLMWLGYLEEDFDYCGHNFVLRTLRGDEDLLAGLVCKRYTEAIGQDKALTWATVALALVAVDGDEDFCPPIGRDKEAWARARFQYCTTKWFWPLAVRLWMSYAGLLQRQAAAMEAVEDLFSGSLPMPSPSADSSTERASSEVHEVPAEILEHLDLPEG